MSDRDPGALEMHGGLRCVNPMLGTGDYSAVALQVLQFLQFFFCSA